MKLPVHALCLSITVVALGAVACVPSRDFFASRTPRGASEADVVEALGEPMARLAVDDVFRKWALPPCRADRASAVWPYHYRLSGAALVFFDAGKTVECVVRTDDVGREAIAQRGVVPPNKRMQLTRSAMANGRRGPRS
jgi:hypothetical protein